ncbi:hypothetical protein TG4357_03717 [Thalassovita gelatinovora]|uniref:DNA cytosine methyltransferase n=1 Tax=Thalassovita gelatinovora TaxID=53501 RepID=A0A0P1FL12_THAGE|nr:hypothetical protein [Thalassovita gelatinovora]QIZ79051.1 hypothetical protein HFZ77_00460 [Thalassovita gelatinovora]CUH68648.1 hypothetical protein TG4357_03717 [Thalassovita gelatinovora]SEQ56079.1 hypothetical protein SAMN04488043_106178 [Thalassovita gelatinovora]
MRRPEDINVLIGCETSGAMREAFLARGFNTFSCDILPADTPTNRHIQDDVRTVMRDPMWHLFCVMHPPCTRLCRAGQRWLYGPDKSHPKKLPKGRTWQDMIAEFEAGCDLFEACLHAPIPLRVVENPVMHKWAKERIRDLPEPQIVQPWWFGDPAFKATGFYLKGGLPKLVPTNKLTPPERGTEAYKDWSAIHRAPPGPDRWKIRSKTFPGIADAAALTWGDHALKVAA